MKIDKEYWIISNKVENGHILSDQVGFDWGTHPQTIESFLIQYNNVPVKNAKFVSDSKTRSELIIYLYRNSFDLRWYKSPFPITDEYLFPESVLFGGLTNSKQTAPIDFIIKTFMNTIGDKDYEILIKRNLFILNSLLHHLYIKEISVKYFKSIIRMYIDDYDFKPISYIRKQLPKRNEAEIYIIDFCIKQSLIQPDYLNDKNVIKHAVQISKKFNDIKSIDHITGLIQFWGSLIDNKDIIPNNSELLTKQDKQYYELVSLINKL